MLQKQPGGGYFSLPDLTDTWLSNESWSELLESGKYGWMGWEVADADGEIITLQADGTYFVDSDITLTGIWTYWDEEENLTNPDEGLDLLATTQKYSLTYEWGWGDDEEPEGWSIALPNNPSATSFGEGKTYKEVSIIPPNATDVSVDYPYVDYPDNIYYVISGFTIINTDTGKEVRTLTLNEAKDDKESENSVFFNDYKCSYTKNTWTLKVKIIVQEYNMILRINWEKKEQRTITYSLADTYTDDSGQTVNISNNQKCQESWQKYITELNNTSSSVYYKEGAEITIPDPPSQQVFYTEDGTAYMWDGWYVNEDGGDTKITEGYTMPAGSGSLSLIAKWTVGTPENYTFTIKITTTISDVSDESEKAVLKNMLIKTGEVQDNGTLVLQDIDPQSEPTVTMASDSNNLYDWTWTYSIPYGKQLYLRQIDQNVAIQASDGNTYTFTGWKGYSTDETVKDSSGNTYYAFTMPKNDVDLTSYMLEGTVRWDTDYASFVRQAATFDKDPSPGKVKIELYLDENEKEPIETLENFKFNYNEVGCVDFLITPADGYKIYKVEYTVCQGKSGPTSNAWRDEEHNVYYMDNVTDETTVKVYLTQPYTAKYNLQVNGKGVEALAVGNYVTGYPTKSEVTVTPLKEDIECVIHTCTKGSTNKAHENCTDLNLEKAQKTVGDAFKYTPDSTAFASAVVLNENLAETYTLVENGKWQVGSYQIDGNTYTSFQNLAALDAADGKMDRVINLTAELKSLTYKVIYKWENAPKTAALPTDTTEYTKGDTVEVDKNYSSTTKAEEGGYTYTFSGWTTTDATVADDGTFTMPGKDVELTGSWEKAANTYKVTYKYTGYAPTGAAAAPAETTHQTDDKVTIDTTVATGTKVEENGYTYTFSGWTTEDATVADDGTFTMPGKDVELTGSWEKTANTYKVTYKYTGYAPTGAAAVPAETTHQTDDKVTVDTTVAAGKTIEEDGYTYTFSGWTTTDATVADNGTFTMPGKDVELTGSWEKTANTYKVTYKYTGYAPTGAAAVPAKTDHKTDETVTVDTTVAAGKTIEENGYTYTFSGWTTTDATVTDGEFTMPASDVTLTGTWTKTANTYAVTYQYSGDVPTGAAAVPAKTDHKTDETVTVDTTVDVNTVVEENGYTYTFSGWTTEDATVADDGTFTMPASDVTLTGTWTKTANTYKVTYQYSGDVPKGATAVPAETTHQTDDKVTVDTTVATGTTVEENGYIYTFSGWTTEDATVTDGEFTMPASNVILTGTWTKTAIEYKVSYEWDGEAPSNAVLPTDTTEYKKGDTVEVNTQYSNTTQVEEDGYTYTFSGWETEDAEVADGAFTMPASNVILTGTWTKTANQYKVTYKYTGDVPTGSEVPELPETKTYQTDDKVTVDTTANDKTVVEENGYTYTFSGWTTENAEVTDGEFTMPASDVTLTGTWTKTAIEYNVSYEWKGEAPSDAVLPTDSAAYKKGDTVKVDDKYSNDTKVEEDGYTYTFSGWTTKNATVTDSEFTMPASNVTLTGTWTKTAIEYNVSYEWKGEAPSDAVLPTDSAAYKKGDTVKVDDKYSNDTKVEEDGYTYTFSGWTTKNATVTDSEFTMPASDVTLTGTWTKTANTYAVTYQYSGDVPTGATAVPAKTDHKTDETVTVDTTVATGTKVEENGYTYTFSGWTTEDATVTNGAFTMPALDVTLTGTWKKTANQYKVTYKYTGDVPTGSEVPELPETKTYQTDAEVTVDTTANDKTVVEENGYTYTFSGWTTTDATVADDGTFTMPGKDVELTGSWEKTANTYKVTYKYTGYAPTGAADAPAETTHQTDDKVTVDTTVATGTKVEENGYTYTFSGWTTTDATVADNGTFTMPGKDVELTGSWEKTANTYKVTYEYTGDVPTGAAAVPAKTDHKTDETVTVDTTVTTGTTVEENGYTYTFSGWTTKDATVTDGEFTMPGNNVTLTGEWKKTANTYEVTYEYSGDVPTGAAAAPVATTHKTDETVTVDTTVDVNTVVEENGYTYTFSGWKTEDATVADDGTFTMPASDVTLTGTWIKTANTYAVTYQYSGEVPTGAAAVPAETTHQTDDEVTVDTTVATGTTVEEDGYTYTFSGWTTEDATVTDGEFTMPASDVTLTGTWKKTANTYAVTYQYSGDVPTGAAAAPAETTHKTGETVTVDATVAAGKTIEENGYTYTFGGWTTTDAEVKDGAFTMPGKTVKLVGTWSRKAVPVPVHNVIIRYEDETGKELVNSVTVHDIREGAKYDVTKLVITLDGYEKPAVPANASGTMGTADITIKVVYKAVKADDSDDSDDDGGSSDEESAVPAAQPVPVILSPKTGDTNVIELWLVLAIIGFSGFITILLIKKHRNE